MTENTRFESRLAPTRAWDARPGHRRHRSTPVLVLIALGVAGLASCRGTDAGGEVGLDGPDRALSWGTETEYTVGGLDAESWAEFGDVSSVGFDDAGNLYILDGQTNEVTVVSPAGEFLRTVGRQGEGPGEVQQAMGMVVQPAGGVLIPDFGHRALVGYGPDGMWTGNVSVNLAREGLPGGGAVALRDGRVVSSQGFRMTMSQGDEEAVTPEPAPGTPVWAWPAQDGEEATVLYTAWESPPPPDDDAREISGSTADGGRIQLRFGPLEAFAPEVLLTALPDGSLAVVDSTAYRIDIVGPDGAVLGEIARPIDPVAVTDGIRDAERERQLAALEDREGAGRVRFLGGSGANFDASALNDAMRARIESMRFYPEIPVIEEISADWAGQIWVQRSSGEPGVDGPTDVVRADGSYVGTLAPAGLRIPDAFGPGGRAAYIEEDDFGVETVRVVRVTEGA